jgi:hypothetical protein
MGDDGFAVPIPVTLLVDQRGGVMGNFLLLFFWTRIMRICWSRRRALRWIDEMKREG